MADVTDFSSVNIGLSEVPASEVSYGVPLLIVDHADVPIDRRYKIVTRSDYTTELTASTEQRNWCATLWGQTSASASQAYIGRWVSAASAAYAYAPSNTTVASAYAALTNTGQLNIVEGAANEDINPDFTGDTTMADVAASIQTALQAGTLTASYTCIYDSFNRIQIISDNTGASADAVSWRTPAAGTDLSGALYLGSSVSQAGLDAEAPFAAVSAILERDNTPFSICERGCDISEQTTLSTGINSIDKYLFLVVDDANAKNSGATTDIGYIVGDQGLNHQKTRCLYTEHTVNNGAATTQYPDAAEIGEISAQPDKEGAISYALNGLSGVTASGLDGDKTTVIPLTATERAALEAKGYDYYVNPAGVVHAVTGLSAGGNETRVMIGKSYMAYNLSLDGYAYLLANDVVTFSDPDIQALKGLEIKWTNEMGSRGLIDLENVTRDYPAASSFSSTQKATHTLPLTSVANLPVLSSVNDITWTLNFIV